VTRELRVAEARVVLAPVVVGQALDPLGDQRVLRLERLDRRDPADAAQLLDVEVRDADVRTSPCSLSSAVADQASSWIGQWIW
jgi:hypothetical protein